MYQYIEIQDEVPGYRFIRGEDPSGSGLVVSLAARTVTYQVEEMSLHVKARLRIATEKPNARDSWPLLTSPDPSQTLTDSDLTVHGFDLTDR